jgi:transposase-like protein
MPIIERKVVPDSIVYSDCWRGYNVLDVSEFASLPIGSNTIASTVQNCLQTSIITSTELTRRAAKQMAF